MIPKLGFQALTAPLLSNRPHLYQVGLSFLQIEEPNKRVMVL